MQRNIFLISMFLSILLCNNLQAWDRGAHLALTKNAAVSTVDEYLKNQVGMKDGVNFQVFYDFPYEIERRIDRVNRDKERTHRTVLDWLETGSLIEDFDMYPVHPVRNRHHFHDPTRNTGMNNRTDNPDFKSITTWSHFDFTGESALTWAVDGTATVHPPTNNQSWQNTRDDFYAALTESAQSEREEFLAKTFLDLGCVLHMLEDMGVPAHVRNDYLFAHFRNINDKGDPLEQFVERHIARTGSLSRWLPQDYSPIPKVFSTVVDYFDADIRPDPYTFELYLGDSIPDTWGLAECTNYQFYSWSTIDRSDTTLYFFQHPDLGYTSPLFEGTAYYRSGYGMQYLVRGTMSIDYLIYPNELDPHYVILGKCLTEYAETTIPRTIDAVAGLNNYFFRGKLDVKVKWTRDPGVANITITNKSMNSTVPQALVGGDFELFAMYENGDLVPIDFESNWVNGQLSYGNSLTGTFTIPAPGSSLLEYYRVVYKGQIVPNDGGSGVPGDDDPDDSDAIACGKTVAPDKVVLYYINCSSVYQQNLTYNYDDGSSSDYAEDWLNFLTYYDTQVQQGFDVRVGLFYVPKPWCPINCTTNTIADVIPPIPPGLTFSDNFPVDIYYEELTIVPTTKEEISSHVSALLGGLGPSEKPDYLIVINDDSESMFNNYFDWETWTLQSASSDPDWVLPGGASPDGPFGIFYNAMLQYVYNEPRYSQNDYAVRTHLPWLHEIRWYMEDIDGKLGL